MLWIHNMQREIMIAITSFILGMLILLLLQQSTLSASHHSENIICNDIPSVLNALGVDNEKDNIQSSTTASASKELSETHHNELLMGYDLLTDIFTAQSQLWLVPILRKLARGTPLVIEISDLIHKLVKSAKYHKKQLLSKKNGLRNLQPNVSRHFIDTNPNKLIDEMGKNIVWNIMSDLSTRGEEFNLHFALVHMASFRIIFSISIGLLEFEPNEQRRDWLKSVAGEYNELRLGLKDTIVEYITCER